jgi:hypothetical protein
MIEISTSIWIHVSQKISVPSSQGLFSVSIQIIKSNIHVSCKGYRRCGNSFDSQGILASVDSPKAKNGSGVLSCSLCVNHIPQGFRKWVLKFSDKFIFHSTRPPCMYRFKNKVLLANSLLKHHRIKIFFSLQNFANLWTHTKSRLPVVSFSFSFPESTFKQITLSWFIDSP